MPWMCDRELATSPCVQPLEESDAVFRIRRHEGGTDSAPQVVQGDIEAGELSVQPARIRQFEHANRRDHAPDRLTVGPERLGVSSHGGP
jgi:hypothetical protein